VAFGFGGVALAIAVLVLAVRAQDADEIQAAVVKIMDTPRPGTGVVVAVEQGTATVLTASHVIQGATKGFRVVFAASPDLAPMTVQSSDVVGMQPDETHGLSAFRVRGVPAAVKAVPLTTSVTFAARQDLVYWGYPSGATRPRNFGGAYSGLEGTLLLMDRSVGEGASGGPVVSGNRVVGITTATDAQTTFAVLSDVAVLALRGWGVRLPATPAPSPNQPTQAGASSVTAPAARSADAGRPPTSSSAASTPSGPSTAPAARSGAPNVATAATDPRKTDAAARLALLASASKQARDWPTYGGDSSGTRSSTLNQIDERTVKDLRVTWRHATGAPDTSREIDNRHTPLMVGGRLFSSVAGGVVAIAATTGERVWTFQPVGEESTFARGLAYWTDGREQRILAVVSHYLWAIDARTGRPVDGFGTGGRVDLGTGTTIPEAVLARIVPVVVKDVVVLGNVTARANEDGPALPSQLLDGPMGYDVRSGKRLWTFRAIPRPGEFGDATWESAPTNSNVRIGWSLVSVDEELGLLYVPFNTATGSSKERPGNNLFADSLVCLDARTGQRRWHYQFVHHGVWGDGASATAPILVDLTVNGRPIKGIAHVSKHGHIYVFDRVTGQPVWPIEERPVRGSPSSEGWSSPTQPFPTKPPAIGRQEVSANDLVDLSATLRAAASEIASMYEYGRLFAPLTPSKAGARGMILPFSTNGLGSWDGGAFDPGAKILFVHLGSLPSVAAASPSGEQPLRLLFGPSGLPSPFKPPYATLTAVDLSRGEVLWQVANGAGPKDRIVLDDRRGSLPDLGTPGRATPLVAGPLVFLGEGSETAEGLRGLGGRMFRAYDKRTGRVLWEMDLLSGASGSPLTYAADGVQFVVVPVSSLERGQELVALSLM
jgi:quinoprotein glucose dehydrogenase